MELLRYVRRHEVTSIRSLAKALSRDYINVHATNGGVRADYDAIETRIAI